MGASERVEGSSVGTPHAVVGCFKLAYSRKYQVAHQKTHADWIVTFTRDVRIVCHRGKDTKGKIWGIGEPEKSVRI